MDRYYSISSMKITFKKFGTKIRKQIKNETCMIRVYYVYFQKIRDKKYGNIYIHFLKINKIIFVLI